MINKIKKCFFFNIVSQHVQIDLKCGLYYPTQKDSQTNKTLIGNCPPPFSKNGSDPIKKPQVVTFFRPKTGTFLKKTKDSPPPHYDYLLLLIPNFFSSLPMGGGVGGK